MNVILIFSPKISIHRVTRDRPAIVEGKATHDGTFDYYFNKLIKIMRIRINVDGAGRVSRVKHTLTHDGGGIGNVTHVVPLNPHYVKI